MSGYELGHAWQAKVKLVHFPSLPRAQNLGEYNNGNTSPHSFHFGSEQAEIHPLSFVYISCCLHPDVDVGRVVGKAALLGVLVFDGGLLEPVLPVGVVTGGFYSHFPSATPTN